GQQYLRRRNVERRAEIARIRAVEEAYRRPVIFGEAIDQNAAVWYGQAFAHVPSTLDQHVAAILTAGPAGLDASAESTVAASCGEMRSPRFQTALRCVRCDWGFGFGFDSLKGLQRSMEIVNLHHCLTAAGHISARAGEFDQAATDYLEGVALGCDLGMADFTLAIIGMDSARRNLTAL